MTGSRENDLEHLHWLVRARGENNRVALILLELFEKYPEKIREEPYALVALQLVGVVFSLWRAAFLSNTVGNVEDKVGDAERFLRKILTDNAIGFAQDVQWREWSASYYMTNARLQLERIKDAWDKFHTMDDLYAADVGDTAKGRWDRLHRMSEHAALRLSYQLKKATSDQNSN